MLDEAKWRAREAVRRLGFRGFDSLLAEAYVVSRLLTFLASRGKRRGEYAKYAELLERRLAARRRVISKLSSVYSEVLRAADVVVDVGCGAGFNAMVARGLGCGLVVGVDCSVPMLRVFKGASGGEPIAGDAAMLPLRSSCADAVFATFVLREVPSLSAVDEMVRVLKPGGGGVVCDVTHGLPAPVVGAIRRLVALLGGRVEVPYAAAEIGGRLREGGVLIIDESFLSRRFRGLIRLALIAFRKPCG